MQGGRLGGFYKSKLWNRGYPRIQLVTIADLLEGQQIHMPPVRQVSATFKKAPKAASQALETAELALADD